MKLPAMTQIVIFMVVLGCKTAAMQSVRDDEEAGEAEAVKGEIIQDIVVPEIIESTKEEIMAEDKEEPPPAQLTCANSKSSILTLSAPLAFTERKDCSFGDGDNLDRNAGYFQAIESQSKTVMMPPVKELCSLTIKSEKEDLHYDDYLFLTLNKRILVSSEVRWTDFFDDQDDFKLFDFKKIRGEDHKYVEKDPTYGTPYCYLDEECQVPDHDKEGPFQLNIKGSSMAGISKLAQDTPEFTFTVIASGDNNDEDCDFSSFDLTLTMEYIPMP